MCLRLFFAQMDVQVMTWLQKEATTPPPSGNLYPKGGNPGKKVENPVAAGCKSLPKRRKPGKKVENPRAAGCKSLPKGRKTREKGRDSCRRRPEISTRIGEICRKGREPRSRRPEISTQNAEKRRSFNITKKADRQVRFDGW